MVFAWTCTPLSRPLTAVLCRRRRAAQDGDEDVQLPVRPVRQEAAGLQPVNPRRRAHGLAGEHLLRRQLLRWACGAVEPAIFVLDEPTRSARAAGRLAPLAARLHARRTW